MAYDDIPAMELRSVGKVFRQGYIKKAAPVRAVSDVSLSVKSGEVYGFLGPNGAGKSTTIRMALGLIRPSSGEVRLFGEDIRQQPALPRVGSLVDGGIFYPFLSGNDNLQLLARMRGLENPPIDELLERVGLTKDVARKVKGYSTGMKQRLGVASALLNDPDLVILDEPANGLDAAGIQDMRVLIRGLAQQGKAVFLSSHMLHEVEQLCDRVAIIAKGQLLRESSVRDILGEAENIWIEAEPNDQAFELLQPHWQVEKAESGLLIKARRDQTPAILRQLHQANIDVFRLSPREHSLEHIFLSMTRDSDGER